MKRRFYNEWPVNVQSQSIQRQLDQLCMYFSSKCLNKQKRTSGLDIKTIKFIILNRRPTSLNSHLQLSINDGTLICQSLPIPGHTALNSYWLGSWTTTFLFDPRMDLHVARSSRLRTKEGKFRSVLEGQTNLLLSEKPVYKCFLIHIHFSKLCYCIDL